MATDFFDDDLIQPDTRRATGDEGGHADAVPALREPIMNLMGRQKQELSRQVAGAIKEIEALRMRQDDLEREKNDLQTLGRKQDAYECGKREIMTALSSGIVVVEKQGIEAAKLAEFLTDTGAKFKALLTELDAIDEERWSEDGYERRLDESLALLENARMEHARAMGRADEMIGLRRGSSRAQHVPTVAVSGGGTEAPAGFLSWLKIGVATTLPLILVIVLLFGLYLFLRGVV